jgi:hypothetical protein
MVVALQLLLDYVKKSFCSSDRLVVFISLDLFAAFLSTANPQEGHL